MFHLLNLISIFTAVSFRGSEPRCHTCDSSVDFSRDIFILDFVTGKGATRKGRARKKGLSGVSSREMGIPGNRVVARRHRELSHSRFETPRTVPRYFFEISSRFGRESFQYTDRRSSGSRGCISKRPPRSRVSFGLGCRSTEPQLALLSSAKRQALSVTILNRMEPDRSILLLPRAHGINRVHLTVDEWQYTRRRKNKNSAENYASWKNLD